MTTLWQDLRYTVRKLARQPGFAAVAALTLALGIGANSAIFSVVNAVLLRPLPIDDPDRVVVLQETFPSGYGTVSVPNLRDWRRRNDVFEQIAAYQHANFSLRSGEEPTRVAGASVTPEYTAVFGASARLGRTFSDDEARPGAGRVVLLSDALWRREFGADPGVVGREVFVGGEPRTVVGVMGPDFVFPSRLTDLWVPLVFTEQQEAARGSHQFLVVGRLKPGVSLERAQEQMSAIGRILEQEHPSDQTGRNVGVVPLQEWLVGYARQALLLLWGTVAVVLLISCTNVANLLLARSASRRKEIAVRAALGAGRGRLVRQLLTESVVLAAVGGALGLALAKAGLDALVALASGMLPRAAEIALDYEVVAFTALLSVATGVIFGLVPALQVSRADVQGALKDGAGSGEGPRRHAVRSALVVAEIALSLMLLVGAGLLVGSFARVRETDPGLRPERVLTMRVALPDAKYEAPESVAAFHRRVIERVSALPGVRHAAVIDMLPIQQYGRNGTVDVEGRPPEPVERAPLVEYRAASDDVFETLGIPLVAGRTFGPQDGPDAPPVCVVNQAFARRVALVENPVGMRVLPGDEPVTIVGVVGDVKQSGLNRAPAPEIYFSIGQAPNSLRSASLVVRADDEPGHLAAAVRAEVLGVDPAQPVYAVQTMSEVIDRSIADFRLNMTLMAVFAAVALLLAVVGIYSVMSTMVAQSTREIGIRMALGARAVDVLRLVVGHGLVLTLAGVVIGAAGALGLSRLIEGLLFGVTPTDPVTYAAVAALLAGVAILACLVPALRAIRVDPMVALRHE